MGLLTEANTAYGESLRRMAPVVENTKSRNQSNTKQALNSVDSRRPSADRIQDTTSSCSSAPVQTLENREKSQQPQVLVAPLPFPLHISRLRGESEKIKAQQNQNSQQASQHPDYSKYLPMPFEDESEDAKDSIPPFSNLETSSSELILANLLSTISREYFDYVGIAATDVRDTIFLVQEVKQHSPSSVMFSLNADLLYIQSWALKSRLERQFPQEIFEDCGSYRKPLETISNLG